MRSPIVCSPAWLLVVCALPVLGCASVIRETRAGDAESVRRLLAEGHPPDEHAGADPASEPRALCIAIARHDAAIAKLLLDAGADRHDGCYIWGDDFYEPVFYAAMQRDAAIVGLLLERGVDPLAKSPAGSSLMQHFLLYTRGRGDGGTDTEGVAGVILDAVLRAHGPEAMKRTAVEALALAGEGDPLVVRQVLSRGIDPNELLGDGNGYEAWPPLYFAVAQGHRAVVDELLRAGASFETRSSEGRDVAAVAGAEWAERVAEQRAFEREEAALRARAEAEERRERAAAGQAQWNAFSGAMTGGAPAQPIANPVDDDRFQREMRAMRDAPAPTGGGAEGAASGSVVVVTASDPPSSAAAPVESAPTPSAPSTGVYTPGPVGERPSSCRDEHVDARIHGAGPTLAAAESALKSMSLQKCSGRGTGPSVTEKDCTETRKTRKVPRNLPDGTIVLEAVEDVRYECTARVTCTKERCTASGPGAGVAQ